MTSGFSTGIPAQQAFMKTEPIIAVVKPAVGIRNAAM